MKWPITVLTVLSCVSCCAQVVGNVAFFASGAPANATAPTAIGLITDSFQQSVWVSYTNGADEQGASGSSTVVEYDTNGRLLKQFVVPGSVDGLKEDAVNHVMWALQNRGGNARLTIISPNSGILPNCPFSYAVEYAERGYQDVAFSLGQPLLSLTNPSSAGDATIEKVAGLSSPLAVTQVLLDGAIGTNLATGVAGQPTSQTSPGALRTTPWGGVMLVSSANGQLIFLRNPDTPQQLVSFLNVIDSSGIPVTGVDDALFSEPGQNLFFATNPALNLVLVIYLYNVEPGQLFALVDSMNALVKIDVKTGVATTVLGNLNGFERMSSLQIDGELR